MTQPELINKIASLIDLKPKAVIKALRLSGVSIQPNANQSQIVNKVSDAIFTNTDLQHRIAELVSTDVKYNNFAISAALATVVSAVSSLATAGIGSSTSKKDREALLEAEREKTKQQLYAALAKNEKGNSMLIPAIIIGGVMVIAAIAVFASLKQKAG